MGQEGDRRRRRWSMAAAATGAWAPVRGWLSMGNKRVGELELGLGVRLRVLRGYRSEQKGEFDGDDSHGVRRRVSHTWRE
jgi:hypothetical protein